MCALHDLAVQEGVVDDAAVERLLEDLGELLLVHLHTQVVEALNDSLVLHPRSPPLKGFAKLPSYFVDDDLSNTIYLDDIIALRHFGDPLALLELLLQTGHGSLLAQLVIKLGKEELDVLMKHATRVGGIGWLGDGKNRDAVLLSEVLCKLDGSTARAGKAVKGVDQNMGDFATMLFNKVQHAEELLATVGLG